MSELVLDATAIHPRRAILNYRAETVDELRVARVCIAKVRTHILFSVPCEESKSMMITSTIPNEGKSTIATLLALSFAATGRKILLIDADMRRPFLHSCLGLKNQKGLHEYLQGRADIENIVQPIAGTSLFLLPGGTPIGNPTEIITSEKFTELISTLQQQYERIFIDVPPVLYIPDGIILAKHIQSTLLVCRSGIVHRNALLSVKHQFDEMKLRHTLIGAVINGMDMENEKIGYKYFASYKNYYHSPAEGEK